MAYRILPGFSSGRTDLPKVQRDALIDDGTLGLFDFNHGWGYAAMATPVAASAPFRNYVRGGADIANNGTAKTWTSGKVNFTTRAMNNLIALPNTWRLPTTATHFAIGFIASVAMTGPALGSGTLNGEIFGCWGATGRQYAMYTAYDGATGAVSAVFVTMNGIPFNVTTGFPTDGAKHHFAIEYNLLTASTWNMVLYVDGVITYTSATQTGSNGTFIDGGANVPAIGTYYVTGTNSYTTALFSIGRIWLQDLSAAGSKTLAAMIAQDITANSNRF
jgi:hypothetical protein